MMTQSNLLSGFDRKGLSMILNYNCLGLILLMSVECFDFK